MDTNTIDSNYTSNDAGKLWPVGTCGAFSATPILPNTTNSRVCGIQTLNTSLLSGCCDGELQQYQCWLYCQTSADIRAFARCVSTRSNSTTISSQTFCQSGIVLNNTERLSNQTDTSFAFRSYSTPKTNWVIVVLLFALFFVGPSSAAVVQSLNNGLNRRQSDGGAQCTFDVDQNYTMLRNSMTQSATFSCGASTDGFCPFTVPVDTGIGSNNRTINRTSAAEPEYDQFFDTLTQATGGRLFPAMSSLEMTYEYVTLEGSSHWVTWTPFAWCVNGTAMNCSAVADGNAAYVEACGPVFVGNAVHLDDPAATIQGTLGIVLTT